MTGRLDWIDARTALPSREGLYWITTVDVMAPLMGGDDTAEKLVAPAWYEPGAERRWDILTDYREVIPGDVLAWAPVVKPAPYEENQKKRTRTDGDREEADDMPINSRAKGKRYQLYVAKVFREHGFSGARRSAQYAGGTGESADVIGGPPGIHVEAKAQEKLRLREWMDQAVRDAAEAGRGDLPAVFHHQNGGEHLVTMRLEDWLTLYDRTRTRDGAEEAKS